MGTFGYETKGAVAAANLEDNICGSMFTITEWALAESISINTKNSTRDWQCKCAIYKHSDLSLVAETTDTTVATLATSRWETFPITTPALPVLLANTEYVLVAWSDIDGGTSNLYYDNGAANQGHIDAHVFNGFPDPLVPAHSVRKFSIYCTYRVLPEDPRYRTKVWLDAYIENKRLTNDAKTSELTYITVFGSPLYPMVKVFRPEEKDVDIIFSIGEPVTTPLIQYDLTAWAYREEVPITIFTVDKTGVSGTLAKWKAETELRRIGEEYPFGSVRGFTNRTDNDQIIGGTKVYGTRLVLNYRRNTIV